MLQEHPHQRLQRIMFLLDYLLEPFKFAYALVESLADPSLGYTIAVFNNCDDPVEARKRGRFQAVDTSGALA